jgi:hypothetical protein
MRPNFNVRITVGVILALAGAIAVLHSLVFLSLRPESLSATMPSAVVRQAR